MGAWGLCIGMGRAWKSKEGNGRLQEGTRGVCEDMEGAVSTKGTRGLYGGHGGDFDA